MTATIQPFTTVITMVGILLLGIGVALYFQQRARIARSLHAEGVVVELLQQRAQGERIRVKTNDSVKLEKKYLYRPVIEFKPINGRVVRFNAGIASRPAPFQAGDKVDVLYDPGSPQQAQINRFLHLWYYVLMCVSFGIFFLVMGLIRKCIKDLRGSN